MKKFGIFSGGYEGRRNAGIDLDQRYGEIGISAVAAAVRFQSPAKDATDARKDDRDENERAA